MAKTRAQPFGNFNTSGAVAGINAIMQGAQTESALIRDKYAGIERGIYGAAAGLRENRESKKRDERWRKEMEERQRQFDLSLSERQAERRAEELWKQKLFDESEDDERYTRARQEILDKQQFGLNSIQLLERQRDQQRLLIGMGLQAAEMGGDKEIIQGTLSDLGKKYEEADRLLLAQAKSLGIPTDGLAGMSPGAIGAILSATARTIQEEEAPDLILQKREEYNAAKGELEAIRAKPATRRTQQDLVKIKKLEAATANYETKEQGAILNASRRDAVNGLGVTLKEYVENGLITPQEFAAWARSAWDLSGSATKPDDVLKIVGDVEDKALAAVNRRVSASSQAEKDRVAEEDRTYRRTRDSRADQQRALDAYNRVKKEAYDELMAEAESRKDPNNIEPTPEPSPDEIYERVKRKIKSSISPYLQEVLSSIGSQ